MASDPIVSDAPTVMRTTNGGQSWIRSTLPGGGQSFNRDICFLDQNLGFISGEDGVWKTFDGGNTWIIITPGGIPGNILGSVWFINADIGVENDPGTKGLFEFVDAVLKK